MKYLIVNGDDFGASRGINRGILDAHRQGILTSASLIVNMAGSEDAALLSRTVPALSVGLHVNFTNEGGDGVVPLDDPQACRAELHRQLQRFRELLGRPPTHLDAHHNVHRTPRLLPHFLEAAGEHGLPLREHSPARYHSAFYGQWDGVTHPEQISTESLVRMLRADRGGGVTELSCHPGYVDPDFRSVYSAERETELRTLCDPGLRRALAELNVELIGFGALGQVAADRRAGSEPEAGAG